MYDKDCVNSDGGGDGGVMGNGMYKLPLTSIPSPCLPFTSLPLPLLSSLLSIPSVYLSFTLLLIIPFFLPFEIPFTLFSP